MWNVLCKMFYHNISKKKKRKKLHFIFYIRHSAPLWSANRFVEELAMEFEPWNENSNRNFEAPIGNLAFEGPFVVNLPNIRAIMLVRNGKCI